MARRVAFATLVVLAAQVAAGPVEKVVDLLTELKGRIEVDAKEEQTVYDKYACWCESTSSRKATAINEAKESLRIVGQDILTLKGMAATLEAEVEELLTDIAANEESQTAATAIRQKENAAYAAEGAEMQQALAALERAIFLLKSATGGAFLQGESSEAARGALQAVLLALPATASSNAALPAKVALLRRAATGYAPQSASIQGILQDMYSAFAVELEAATKSEATSNRNFEGLIATKQAELSMMQASVAKKQTKKAEAEAMLAESEQSYDDTEQQLQADIDFFDATKASCSAKSDEWKTRAALRREESEGIAQALEILSSDAARELFSTAIQPGAARAFLQLSAVRKPAAAAMAKSAQAYEALRSHATAAHSLRLARMAVTVRTADVGHFDKVLKAIDAMVQTLKSEDLDDIVKKDQCTDEYHEINRTVEDVSWKITVNEAKIAKLQRYIESDEADKVTTIEAIQLTQAEMVTMAEQRNASNKAFLQAKAEDNEAIGLLSQAKAALSSYYVKNNVSLVSLLRAPVFDVSRDQAPNATFSAKGHRKGESKGIIAILDNLIEDLGAEIRQAQQDEAAAQLDYERAYAAAEDLVARLEEKKVGIEGAIADNTDSKGEETKTKGINEENKTDTKQYEARIKPDCDWILSTFSKRAERRQAEMQGLAQAKEFLAGYQVSQEVSLVQGKRRVVPARVHRAA